MPRAKYLLLAGCFGSWLESVHKVERAGKDETSRKAMDMLQIVLQQQNSDQRAIAEETRRLTQQVLVLTLRTLVVTCVLT